MYPNEQRLDDALLPFLATALFGLERSGYWRTCLEAAAEPECAAPTKERAAEVEAEIADPERRLTHQLVNLEADDVTSALRRRVGQRVAELEDAVAERRERLVALARDSATEAPTLADVAPLLVRLPILASSLDTAPQGELRAMFDALQLDVVYQPADSAVDVAVTLSDRGGEPGAVAAQVRAEDWSAGRPAGLAELELAGWRPRPEPAHPCDVSYASVGGCPSPSEPIWPGSAAGPLTRDPSVPARVRRGCPAEGGSLR